MIDHFAEALALRMVSGIIQLMIIDFHTHIFPREIKENRQDYLGPDACFAELYSSPKASISTAEELIASMDENGIDVSVALNIGWSSQETCRRTNDYILDSAARYPKRLVPFCAIQPADGEAAAIELERCARAGARGIGELRSDSQGFDLGDVQIMGPVVETAIKHRLLFSTHTSEPVGHQYAGKGTITPAVLYRFICSFPELRVICAHWGGGLPFYALMPEVATALANTYFDTAATPFLYRPQIYRHMAEIAGVDKILLGSDYPLMSPKRVISQMENAGLSQEAKAMILGGNARRLLEWSRSAVSSP
ncbi:MAG: amidohydrolase family protein [Chloroflexi bacterium]|nr:amidohydrolase family protein [Chloroflexota bacterium]